MKLQVESIHYFNKSYDSKERFISYWHQIDEIIKLNPKNVLEIGIGNSFVSKYLKEKKIKAVTLDIDKELNPNVVGSVLNLPFPDLSFVAVACYEVLEHLPYENFQNAISELYRVSISYVLLSLPDVNRSYCFHIQIPKLGEIKVLIPLPRIKKYVFSYDGQHEWEIGRDSYPLRKIIADIQRVGFHIEKTYRIFENPYHRFFILKK